MDESQRARYGRQRMRVLGIDLSAGQRKTYACVLEADSGGLRATMHERCGDAELLELARGCGKVAIDAPFGWPRDFTDALIAHRSGASWPAPDDEDPAVFRASLSFRLTDRITMQTRRPLSVSTDRLGATAMRCAHLLQRWSARKAVDRTGRGRFVEVYPAGALARWGLEPSGYKDGNEAQREDLLTHIEAELPALTLDNTVRSVCIANDDAFDALVAALVGRAGAIGLTTPPSSAFRDQATEEGWIHLPLRGSLPFLARAKSELAARPLPALARPLKKRGVRLDEKGYAKRVEDVLLSTDAIAAIKRELSGKGGSELVPRRGGGTKFLAAHSSTALAANTFGPFLADRADVPIAGRVFAGKACLEGECPTGISSITPTLDFLLDGPEVLAVESKCTEPFNHHRAQFRDAYGAAMTHVHASWRAEYDRLVADPWRFRFLDAAQLVKHYLGLRTTYPGRPITFAYLYWVPSNASQLAPCGIHAAEVTEFSRRVNDPKVEFLPMSYSQLWGEWASRDQPLSLRRHAQALKERYEVTI